MVDFNGPGVNAPDQVLHVGETLLEEKSHGVGTAHAFMAQGHDFIGRVELIERLGNVPKGMRVDPSILAMENSCGSRTSNKNTLSPLSKRSFSSRTVMV